PVPAADEAALRLFSERGYSEVRRFWDMAIELHEPPDVPELPAPLVLEPYREEDARPFHAAMIESFEDHWEWHGAPFEEWLELRRGQHADEQGPLWFLVRDREESPLSSATRPTATVAAGWACSASGGRGAAAGSARRCSTG